MCYQQIKGGNYSPLLSSGETTSGLVCLVLGSLTEIREFYIRLGHIRIVQSWATEITEVIGLCDK